MRARHDAPEPDHGCTFCSIVFFVLLTLMAFAVVLHG